jgi:hypothetical protein
MFRRAVVRPNTMSLWQNALKTDSPLFVRMTEVHCCLKASVRFRFSKPREILLTVRRGISFCSSRGAAFRKRKVLPCAIMTSCPMASSR